MWTIYRYIFECIWKSSSKNMCVYIVYWRCYLCGSISDYKFHFEYVNNLLSNHFKLETNRINCKCYSFRFVCIPLTKKQITIKYRLRRLFQSSCIKSISRLQFDNKFMNISSSNDEKKHETFHFGTETELRKMLKIECQTVQTD